MMARPYWVVVVLLLTGVSRFGEGSSNPELTVRITKKGLEYAQHYAVATLKKELSKFSLPDYSGRFPIGWLGQVQYNFHSLKIHQFERRDSDLSLLPPQGIRASLSSYLSVGGSWKVKKAFINLQGTFDLKLDGVSISVSLNLGKDQSGRPTASVAHCSNSVRYVRINISGGLSWILNLSHERIESTIKNILEQKICEMVRTSTTSHLEPFLRTLPVTSIIDQVAGIDHRLVEAPQVTSNSLDIHFKGEFFSRSQHSPVPFEVPALRLPQQYESMVYFAVSEYIFNTASRVYHQAGLMHFTIRNEHVTILRDLAAYSSASRRQKEKLMPKCHTSSPPPSTTIAACFFSSLLSELMPPVLPIQLHTSAFKMLIPRLARSYPNMEIELEVSPESEPFVMFTPGNVTVMPVMDIQAFVLLPNSSDRNLVFQLRAKADVSLTINVNSSRINGSVMARSKLKLELKHSNIGYFRVELLQDVFNDYAHNIMYPSVNAKLKKGFLLPFPSNIFLKSMELQIHKHFLLVGATIN